MNLIGFCLAMPRSMVIGLDEIVGKRYNALGLTGLLQALVEKRVATIKLLCERLHCKNKQYSNRLCVTR